MRVYKLIEAICQGISYFLMDFLPIFLFPSNDPPVFGTKCWSHKNLNKLTEKQITKEITRTLDGLKKYIPVENVLKGNILDSEQFGNGYRAVSSLYQLWHQILHSLRRALIQIMHQYNIPVLNSIKDMFNNLLRIAAFPVLNGFNEFIYLDVGKIRSTP